MKVIIHRGSHQIGGCCTEIATDRSRILIDFGAELDGNAELNIKGITGGNSHCNAVLFSHYHGDHIGLIESINKDIPLFIGELSLNILKMQNDRRKTYSEDVINRISSYKTGYPFVFGDIKVTPFMVDHSAFDSHMFLIEADGKKVLHTGDFRQHGFRGKGLIPTLEKYVGEIDVLICEGTTISRNSQTIMTESELTARAKSVFENNKYVFIACASTNIDRIAAFCSAVPSGKYCICDAYQKKILDVVKEKSGSRSALYTFPKALIYSPSLDDKMLQRGFCAFIRPGNYLSNKLLEQYKDKDPLIVYSMWHGYLEQNNALKNALSDFRMVELHTSGHADSETIDRVISKTKPKLIIPIHTDTPEQFANLSAVRVVDDGEILTVT